MTHDTHAEAPQKPRQADKAAPAPKQGDTHSAMAHSGRPYLRLAIMAALSFAAMYVLMYAMVDRFANIYANASQAYMAALMAAPMVVIELLLMGAMYPNKRTNAIAIAASVIIGAGAFFAIRDQAAVGDQQFVLSMIPHHGAAILMCEQAPITDPEIQQLCFGPQGIVASQQREIQQMKAILARS